MPTVSVLWARQRTGGTDDLAANDTASEATVRQWLTRECHQRAQDHNSAFEEGEWGSVGDDHGVWTLPALGPFARRLRLWTGAVKLSAPTPGAAIGVGRTGSGAAAAIDVCVTVTVTATGEGHRTGPIFMGGVRPRDATSEHRRHPLYVIFARSVGNVTLGAAT
ncbi:hypothetical protein E6R60_09420 [Streptomyces sp. A0642]|uniref:hypothetical protein n=1 Tax=Streptomyces sp. A0642 TaxID=2563100 RepID=UPI0010A1FB2D|nr:hypothetical protein [Streptomyces sp. A0642]THA77726.1 hypothetical protein E6R60_09420 [Streptomyces sp. A0642]